MQGIDRECLPHEFDVMPGDGVKVARCARHGDAASELERCPSLDQEIGPALLIAESAHHLGDHEQPEMLLKATENYALTPGYVHYAVPG